jgi:BirA family transcriptional regulator, biotin operon repressor / biotin---[acetyl-CoA-carboxylase] ligase
MGQQLVELDRVDSTNKHAAELLALSKLRHGAVILAHDQTAGRGQRGRSWRSVAGLDLTFSLVVRPAALRADEQFVLSKLAALAVHDVVRERVAGEVRIKWPNDILIERAKVAGILIQNELAGERVNWSIIGIGLNVNSTDHEAELHATSLGLATGRPHDRHALLQDLCARFEELWLRWEGGDGNWSQAYTERLWSKGRWAAVTLDDKPLMVRPMEVDRQGRLIVETEEGQVGAYGLDRLRFAPR